MGRSAYIVRREGRYLFRTRWPRCLTPDSGSASIRIAFGTAAYPVALRRASRIAGWIMPMKASDTAEQALRGLLPKLQHFAVTPIKDEDDLAERKAFEQTLVAAAGRMYLFRLFPEKLIPGWDRAVGPFLSEIRAAENALAARHSPAGYQQRLEANRAALLRQGRAPLVMPEIAAGDETGSNPPAGKGQSPARPARRLHPAVCACAFPTSSTVISLFGRARTATAAPRAKSPRSSSSPSTCCRTRSCSTSPVTICSR